MAQKRIDIGTGYDTGDGDKLRDGGGFINDNFDELYARATSWRAGTFNQRTCVIHNDGLYILKQSAGVPYNSVNISQEIINGDWIFVGPDGGYDDAWIQPSINQRVRFKGQWVNAAYNANDWVISDSWMGVAKVDTSDPFPPQADGSYQWLLPEPPTWEDLTLVGDIYYGMEFYGLQLNTIDGFRVWSNGVSTESYKLFVYEITDSGGAIFLDFEDLGGNLPLGWNVVDLQKVATLIPNQKYRLIVEVHGATDTQVVNDNWQYYQEDDDVTSGQMTVIGGFLSMNQNSSTVDQSALLDSLVVGDEIYIAEADNPDRFFSYRISSVEPKVGQVYEFGIVLAATGNLIRNNRNVDVRITHKGVAVSTNYDRLQNYWSGIPELEPDQVRGFVTQDPDVAISPNPGFDDNAYGVDLFFQTYILSDDWFYIAVGEASTNNSGGGTDIEIVDNLTTQDTTVALSGNMGYVLDQKIAAIPTIDLLPYMLIGSYATQEANKVDTAINAEKLGGQLPSNYIQLAGNEVNPMTGMIYGGQVTTDATSGGNERVTTKQLGGFVTYQGIEQSPGSGTYSYSEGVGEDVLSNNEAGFCVAIGFQSLQNNKGFNTIAVGLSTGQNNEGASGLLLGQNAGQNNTGGNAILVGGSAGLSNAGNNSIGIGGSAINGNQGNENIGIGAFALSNATGAQNVAIGQYAGNADPMPYTNTVAIGQLSNPTQDNQVVFGNADIESVRVGNPNYVAIDEADLVPKSQTAISDLTGEMTGAVKADNQVVISEDDYGDGSGSVTGTLYFLKP